MNQQVSNDLQNAYNFDALFYFDKDPTIFSKIVPVTLSKNNTELTSLQSAARNSFNIGEKLNFILVVQDQILRNIDQLVPSTQINQKNNNLNSNSPIKITPLNFEIHVVGFTVNVESQENFTSQGRALCTHFCAVNALWSTTDFTLAMKAVVANVLSQLDDSFNSTVPLFDIKVFNEDGIRRETASAITSQDDLLINIITDDPTIFSCMETPSHVKKRSFDEYEGNLSTPTAAAIEAEPPAPPLQSQQTLALAHLAILGFPVSKEVLVDNWDRYSNVDAFAAFVLDHPELWLVGNQANEPPPPPPLHNIKVSTVEDDADNGNNQDSKKGIERDETDYDDDILNADDFPYHIPMDDDDDDFDNEGDENTENREVFYDAIPTNEQTGTFASPILNSLFVKFRDVCGVELNEAHLIELCSQFPGDDEFEAMVNHYWNNEECTHYTTTTHGANAEGGVDLAALQAEEIALAAEQAEEEAVHKEAELPCPLCLEVLPISKLISLCSDHSHLYCYPCLLRYIQSSVNASEDSAPHIPACPNANGSDGCHYIMREQDIESIVNVCMQLPEQLDCSWEQSHELLKTVSQLYLIRAFRNMNCVRCPSCPMDNESECYWVSLPPDNARHQRVKVACPTCGGEFCSSCLRTPYHYHCGCDEVVNYSRAWMDWVGGGRDIHVQELARQNEQYREAFADYARQKEAHDREVTAAQLRFRELQTNEEYFAKVCKRCPRCNAAVEKISGCDAMVCGRDYHGGNVGNSAGCGQAFNWSTAPPYVANTGEAKVPGELNVMPPEQAHLVQHFVAAEIPLRCDECHEPIVGPCIRCLNCPSYNLCLQCSIRPQNPNDAQYIEGHSNRHICTVVFESAIVRGANGSNAYDIIDMT